MEEFIKEVHYCTRCGEVLKYTKKGSWYNAKKRKDLQGFLHCKTCKDLHASEANKGNKKITGRPKGSKNNPEIIAWNKGFKENIKNVRWEDEKSRQLVVARRNGYETYEEYRVSLPALKLYRIDVRRITEKQPLHLLENYDKRSVNGTEGGYTLDHKISIIRGFKENIPAEVIGNIDNLQMIPWKENIQKGWKGV